MVRWFELHEGAALDSREAFEMRERRLLLGHDAAEAAVSEDAVDVGVARDDPLLPRLVEEDGLLA